ncbi:MAG: hypothetical protein J6Y85_04085, partial [Alphaproteobacteria bacterium]|nr:hypothetical protein [Alphaproteobacteria bacterium]
PGGMFARCLDPIRSAENSPEDRPRNLNAVLYNLTERKIPNTVERPYMDSLEEERRVIQLTLAAGADPNYTPKHPYHDQPSVFDSFMRHQKYHGALEVAKTEGFVGPAGQVTFEILKDELTFYRRWGRPYPGETKEESALYAQRCKDAKELVYVLFAQEIYPYDSNVRKFLEPVYQEEKTRMGTECPAWMKDRKEKSAQQQVTFPVTEDECTNLADEQFVRDMRAAGEFCQKLNRAYTISRNPNPRLVFISTPLRRDPKRSRRVLKTGQVRNAGIANHRGHHVSR